MSTDAISSLLTTKSTSASSQNAKTTDKNSLDMSDFISLLVAQLQNQDMNNTTDSTEFMAQMAQYSMVQAITDMSEQSKVASSFNLIGKGATVAVDSQTVFGVIDGVSLYNNEVKVVIDGKEYSMDDVTEVFDASLLDTE